MADNRHNPNMLVHSTNGIVDTTSGHNADGTPPNPNNGSINPNSISSNNNMMRRNGGGVGGNILERVLTNDGNINVSSSSSLATSASSVLLTPVSASTSSTVHALADSVMIPFSASDLDVLRASLAATTNSLSHNNNSGNNNNIINNDANNPNNNNLAAASIPNSNNNNISVCINAGNIIVNADGHFTLDGATNALLNGISSSSMVGCVANVSAEGAALEGVSDLLQSNSNEISSNSGNCLDHHHQQQQEQHRLNDMINNSDHFLNASSITSSRSNSSSINNNNNNNSAGMVHNVESNNNTNRACSSNTNNNIVDNSDNHHNNSNADSRSSMVSLLRKNIIVSSNNNNNGDCSSSGIGSGGVVSGQHIPISMASLLANVNVVESGTGGIVSGASSSGFSLPTSNQNNNISGGGVGTSLNPSYRTLRNQMPLPDGNNAGSFGKKSSNGNAVKSSFKNQRSLLSGNSLLQQHLKREMSGNSSGGGGNNPVVGSSSSGNNNSIIGNGRNVIGIVSGGGSSSGGGISNSSVIERTATANIHHRASGQGSISSSSGGSSTGIMTSGARRIPLSSQMNLVGRVVSSSDAISRENSAANLEVHAGNSQAGPSSSSSIWLQPQQQPPQNPNFPSTSQQAGGLLSLSSSRVIGGSTPQQSSSRGPSSSSSASSLTSTVDLQQQQHQQQQQQQQQGVAPPGGLVSISIAGDLSQPHIVQMGNATSHSFQSQDQQFQGLFQIPVQQEEAPETFQAVAHSTFDQQTAGPSNVTVHHHQLHHQQQQQQYRDLRVGGDSEAMPSSYPSMQMHQQQHHHQQMSLASSDNGIAESLNGAAPIVDSSTIQSYNLVYDTETRKITVQRVISPSDSTVSQSTLSLEGSEATPNPALMPMVSQGYAMVQVNPMPSAFSQHVSHGGDGGAVGAGNNGGGEVSTSSMCVAIDMDDHVVAGTSAIGVGGVLDGGGGAGRLLSSSSSSSAAANAAQNIVVLHHHHQDSGLDDTTECDTTQEDVEFEHPQSPPPYSTAGTSNSIDDDNDNDGVTSLDSSTPDIPASSLAHRIMNHPMLRGQSSSSLSSTRVNAMEASGGLASVVVAMETDAHPVMAVDAGRQQASSLSSTTPSASALLQQQQQQQHQHQQHLQSIGRMMQSAEDVLPSTSGLQSFDSVAGPSHTYIDNHQDESMPQSSGLELHIRKSRRLELQGQEPRASQRKKENSYKTQCYSVNQLWCDECMLSYDGDCPIHRLCPVVDKVVLSRAWASCPTQLQICRLVDTTHESGESAMGVFARRQIGKLTQFGPFIGQLVDSLDEVATCVFPLMVEQEDRTKRYFDTKDENQCNWMMFVRPAKTFAEQNVVAFQYRDHVYFTVTKVVEAKQELKIWYAAHYAERLGLKPLELTEEDMQVLDESDAKFPCFECSRRFRSSAALQKHLEMVHENDDLLAELNIDGGDGGAGIDNGMMGGDDGDDDDDGDYKVNISGYNTGRRRRGGEMDEEEGGDGRGRRRGGGGKRKGVIVQGKLIQGKGKSDFFGPQRQRENFQWKKKSTSLYINKTLKKYKKRVQSSDKGPVSGRSSMYTRQGRENGGNFWVCTHCGLTFDKRSLLNLHTLTHAAEDLVAGEEGMMQIDPAKTEFGQGEPNQVGEGGFISLGSIMACPKCSVVFTDQRELMNHVATHAQKPIKREKPYDCQHCSKSFSTEEKLAKHSIVHGAEEDKPLECTVCQKRLVNNAAMACHMKTHSDRKYYDCPVCNEDFDSSLELKDHAHKHHVDGNGHYPCHNCVKVFDDFQMLKRHIKAFHSTRVFECEYCGKEFCRLDKLKLHMLKHTSHREFMCDQCGRQFKRKDKLKEHTKRLHSKERMEEELKIKESGGHGVKKFVPKVMPSEYHRFIYKCHSCLLGFKRRGMLVNHLAKRHPEMKPEHVPELNLPILKTQKDFYCQYCDKIYKSSSKRKAHILKIHPGLVVPPSARKKPPLTADDGGLGVVVSANGNLLTTGGAAGVGGIVGGAAGGGVGGNGQPILPSNTFSHTVGSITTMPHGCKFCHKQYASKAKLLQHQRKKHAELVEPSSAKKRARPFKSEYLQITVGDPTVGGLINERYETVPMVTVVTQPGPGGDQLTGPADLLTQAMTEIQQSFGSDFATALNPRLAGGNNNGTMQVQIQPSQLAQTIDINQLNQALQSMTSAANQGGVTTVLAPPPHHASILQPQQLPPTSLQQHHLPQQQQQQQQPVQLITHTSNGGNTQLQQGVHLVTAGGTVSQAGNTINLNGLGGGSQFITSRTWPNSFTSQFS